MQRAMFRKSPLNIHVVPQKVLEYVIRDMVAILPSDTSTKDAEGEKLGSECEVICQHPRSRKANVSYDTKTAVGEIGSYLDACEKVGDTGELTGITACQTYLRI
jgi:hypothetical protein